MTRKDERPRCPYCLRLENAESRRTKDRGYIVGRPDRVRMTPLMPKVA
jgi:hypothetical protein